MKSYKMTFLCIIFSSIFGLLSKMSLTSPKLSSFIGLFQFLMLITIMSIVVSVYNTIKKIFDLTEQNIKLDTMMKNQELRKKQETELKVMKDNAEEFQNEIKKALKAVSGMLENNDIDQNADRHPDSANDHDHAIGQRTAHIGDRQPQCNGQPRFQNRQRDQQNQRRPETRQNDTGNGFTGTPAVSEIETDSLFQKYPELYIQRLIDPQLPANIRDLFGIGNFSGQHIGRIPPDPVEKQKNQQQHSQKSRDHLPETTDQIRQHSM